MPRRLGIAGLLTLFIGAGSAQEIQWEGYGTVAAHRGDDAVAGVRADGRNRHFSRDGDWVFDGDSLLAVQAQASHPRLGKLVWQALARDDVRHGLRPRTEWLYWSQETESGWQWRLGRTALPIFLHSETRHLGYAQTTARPANVVYQINPFTHVDGVQINHHRAFGPGELKTDVYWGKAKLGVPAGEVKAEHLSGLALRWDQGPWSLRYGHHSLEFDTAVPAIERLLSELSSGRTGCSNCVSVLARRVPTRGIHTRIHSLALQYDSGPWLLSLEATARQANSTLAARAQAWYVLAAHRMGDWTPYAVLGEMRFREPPLGLLTLPQAGPVAAAAHARIDRYLQTPNDRRIWQLGLRWDFRERMALKLQVEGYRSTGEPGLGQSNFLEVPSPPPIGSYSGPVWDGRVRQLSVNLDFLF